jgi:hypothetical protein
MMDPMFHIYYVLVSLLRELISTLNFTLYFLKLPQYLSPWKIPLPFIVNFISHFYFHFLSLILLCLFLILKSKEYMVTASVV